MISGRNVIGFIVSPKRRLCRVLLVVTAQYLMFPTAVATTVCQWIDENGRVEFSDAVPDEYSRIATCTYSRPVELPLEQGAADKRAKDGADKISPDAKAPSNAAPTQGSVPKPDAKQPSERITDSTDCNTWRRLYDESGACFAPFRTAGGGVKTEAFDKCNEVPSPEEKCGPERN